ncbi:MAG: penicillin-binding protein 2 [Sedimentisphaerales bacterium]|nr:penicillin-binding protein 2 [Sedimentisphaerales bacterium]
MEVDRRNLWWGRIFLGVMLLALLGVVGWCYYLQRYKAEYHREKVRVQQLKIIPQTARRGAIVDREGRLLAVSCRSSSVWVDPSLIKDAEGVAGELAKLLGLKQAELAEQIRGRSTKRFMWIKRFVSEAEAESVRGLKCGGVGIQEEYERQYPMGSSSAHVLGFTDIDGRGLEGIEAACEDYLAQRPGQWRLRSDALRRPIGSQGDCEDGRDGKNVVLTVDTVIQKTVEKQLELTVKKFHAESAVGMVMDPRSGEILAMANYPSFKPGQARQVDSALRRNRVLTDPVEPGSTFKPFTVASALEGGYVSVNQEIFCHNGYYAGKGFGVIREYDGHGYGNLSVADVIARSSNIGSAKIAQKMGKNYFFSMIEKFGFGKKSGIDLPGEGAGILMPLEQWKWGQYALTRASYGQGPVAVTPLQLIRGFCCLSNGGRLITPRIIRGVLDADGTVVKNFVEADSFKGARRVISEEVSRQMVTKVLKGVVDRLGGSAHNAYLEGYQVYGKTGTANIPKKDGRGYEENKYISSFIAGAPAADPRICVLVMVRCPDRSLGLGYTGGQVAAPAVREIIRDSVEYLGVEKIAENEAADRNIARR